MLFIPNKDLYGAMDLKGKALSEVRDAAKAGHYKDAASAWGTYFAKRRKPLNMPPPAGDTPDPSIIHEAERVVNYEIQGWHNVTYKFGKDINFNADWGRSGIYGTHYLAWTESLRKAFEQTGDTRYPECFDDIFNQWYDQRDKLTNPNPNTDVIFYELGVGGRNPRLIDHYYSYRKTGILSWRTHERMLKTILGGSRWLYKLEKEEGYRSGNWQMCGCWALVYAGGLFPEFKEAKAWVNIGVKRLLEHVDRDFYADGCHHERSSGYGGWCTRMSEDLLTFSKNNEHVNVKADIRGRIVQMYDWLLSTATPLGESQGFNDGGFGKQDGPLKNGVSFTRNGKYLWTIRNRVKSVDGIRPKDPGYTSIDQRPSGFAVMRSGWETQAKYMVVNYGPWGGGHTHNDLLDFGLYAFGKPLAVETARWGPYDNPLDHYFRSPQAHNQVVVNDSPMDRVHNKGENVTWATGNSIDFFSATNLGYKKEFEIEIQRSITYIKPDYFLVSDTILEGVTHKAYTWYLHSPDKWIGGKARSLTSARPGLQVVPAKPSEIRQVRRGTSYETKDGAPQNRYWIGLQKYVKGEGTHSVVYDVALVPYKTKPGPVKTTRLKAEVGGKVVGPEVARGVQIERGTQTDLVVYGSGKELVSCSGLQFKGKVCVVSMKRGKPTHVSVVDGGEVEYKGKKLIGSVKEGLVEKKLGG
jgi:hypothetical protein